MIYRKATRDDEDRIKELFIEMLQTIYHTDDVKGYEDGYLDRFFSGGENYILIAEDDGYIAAYLGIQLYRDEDYIYLDDLSVTEKYRNRGIGTRMMKDAEQYARDTGVTAVIFHVEKSNESAHRLYERLGYRNDLEEGCRIRMIKERFLPEVLETERLILRPLTMRDKPAIYKWAGDPAVSKFMMYSNYQSPDDADSWLNDLYSSDKDLDYGFVWKETGELIGSGGMNYYADEDIWHIGYNLRHDMWGKGITTEACRKIVDHARKNYEVKKIVACFADDNPASGRVMEKLGMKYQSDCEYSKFDSSATFKAKNYEIVYEHHNK